MRRGSEASGGSSESFFGSLLSRRRIRHLVAALILLAFCLASGRAFGLFGGWSSASVDRVDAVLQPQLSLIVSSDAPTVAPPIVPDAETGDDGEENALFAEVQTLVPVSLHVMSRCPGKKRLLPFCYRFHMSHTFSSIARCRRLPGNVLRGAPASRRYCRLANRVYHQGRSRDRLSARH